MKNYDSIMKSMTPEMLAELGVKLVSINNGPLYYMTSSGQLFHLDQYQDAIRHEYNWLMYDNESSTDEVGEPDSNE